MTVVLDAEFLPPRGQAVAEEGLGMELSLPLPGPARVVASFPTSWPVSRCSKQTFLLNPQQVPSVHLRSRCLGLVLVLPSLPSSKPTPPSALLALPVAGAGPVPSAEPTLCGGLGGGS